jgi:hypothetical protein
MDRARSFRSARHSTIYPTSLFFLRTGPRPKRDHDAMLIPVVEAAFERHRGIRRYYDATADFSMDTDVGRISKWAWNS